MDIIIRGKRKPKREAISKRTRFEVFKRDQFKCQYCGAASPEVLLVIDHITPVAEGGTRDIMNLLTACQVCNSGKGAVQLSDSAAVTKQMAQVRLLAERREQMEMLVSWRDSLASLENDKVQILVDRVNGRLRPLFNSSLNDFGRERVKGWIKKFGMESSLYGIDQATETSSGSALIDQMEQYTAAAFKVAREPELRDYWRIRSLLRGRRFKFYKDWIPLRDMRGAFKAGFTIAEIDAAAHDATDYDHFLSLIGYEVGNLP